MKPFWQQQQDQMRKQQQAQWQKQQEMWRKQQMQAAWVAQQKGKKQASGKSGAVAPPAFSPDLAGGDFEKYSRVEQEVASLRKKLVAGQMGVDQVKDRLKDLMVQDEAGQWWTVGYETWQWYHYDGHSWVRADPYPGAGQQAFPGGGAAGFATARPKKGHPFLGIVVFLVCLAITVGLGFLLGNVVSAAFGHSNDMLPLICASIGWIGGLILSIVLARKVWRG
jgi:hypothetical protein